MCSSDMEIRTIKQVQQCDVLLDSSLLFFQKGRPNFQELLETSDCKTNLAFRHMQRHHPNLFGSLKYRVTSTATVTGSWLVKCHIPMA